jgi:hypothetical protein
MPPPQDPAGKFEESVFILATPAAVYGSFFSPEALQIWWQAVRSVTTPVPFGVYAIEWNTTSFRDELLGPLGGVLHGTVVDVKHNQQFLVADCWWVPPEGNAIGPMALQITCQAEGSGCTLSVRQDGCEPSPRWLRYYAVISRNWQLSLAALKKHLEPPDTGVAGGAT